MSFVLAIIINALLLFFYKYDDVDSDNYGAKYDQVDTFIFGLGI